MLAPHTRLIIVTLSGSLNSYANCGFLAAVSLYRSIQCRLKTGNKYKFAQIDCTRKQLQIPPLIVKRAVMVSTVITNKRSKGHMQGQVEKQETCENGNEHGNRNGSANRLVNISPRRDPPDQSRRRPPTSITREERHHNSDGMPNRTPVLRSREQSVLKTWCC